MQFDENNTTPTPTPPVKNTNKWRAVGIISLVLLVALIAAGIFAFLTLVAPKDDEIADLKAELALLRSQIEADNSSSNSKLEKGTFKLSDQHGGAGTVQVEGYATTAEKDDGWEDGCDEEACAKVDYVIFNILRTENSDFKKFLETLSGNSFVDESAIGIGCIEDGILSWANDSDATGMKTYNLSKSDTTAIMNATKEKPIILELERFEFTGGSGAPACYSHISAIKIIP